MKPTTENSGRYNIRPKKETNPSYRTQISPKVASQLYDKIMNEIVVEKKYKDPTYSASQMAKELKTNVRYLSAVINSRLGCNYNTFVNGYRLTDAKLLLTDKRYADKTIEEISAMVGFTNRQSFYATFFRFVGVTPKKYREEHKR